jgi:hypothetical protein
LILTPDYSVAVLGAMALIAALDWLFYARHHFYGPGKATLDAVEEENRMYHQTGLPALGAEEKAEVDQKA